LAKSRGKPRARKSQLIRFGHREIETLGLSQGFWTDLYHRSMTVYWPVFFGSARRSLSFSTPCLPSSNYLGDAPIANVPSGRPLDFIYFSIETLEPRRKAISCAAFMN